MIIQRKQFEKHQWSIHSFIHFSVWILKIKSYHITGALISRCLHVTFWKSSTAPSIKIEFRWHSLNKRLFIESLYILLWFSLSTINRYVKENQLAVINEQLQLLATNILAKKKKTIFFLNFSIIPFDRLNHRQKEHILRFGFEVKIHSIT